MDKNLIRLFDIILSLIGLIILTPLFFPIIIILKFTGEGEIFYLQERVGKDGKLFKIIKFTTMLKDSPHMGTGLITIKDDPRILPFGRFLRRTKINELPQLINVLKGDISFVGPRPQTPRCFYAFPEEVQKEIIKVKPGITSLAAVVFRNEEEMLSESVGNILEFYDKVIAPYKGQLEKWIVKNINLKNYFLIIIATIIVVVFPKAKFYLRWFKDLPLSFPNLNK